ADLFLPAASFLERVELCDYYGTLHAIPYITLRKKVLKVGEAISDLNFWIKLARKMGYDQYFPWQNEEEAINFALEPTNLKIEDFKEHPKGMSYGSLRLDQYKQKGFATPSKKVELFSQTLLDMGYDPLPVHEENPENPFSSLYNELPLIMTTGARSLEYLHSGFRNIDKLKNRNPEPLLEIHPETAKSYGVKDGDMVIVENLQGKLKIKIKFSKDIKIGVVNIPHGWPDANVNLITKDFSADPITGYPALKASLCKIRKA
ncbi:MAG: molybdopterin oxidoreductase, partial [Deltaproteobacteria bacterium]